MMRLAVFVSLSAVLFAWNPEESPNVNSRYTVEAVRLAAKHTSRLTETTRRDMESVVGQSLDSSLLDRLAARIKKELRVDKVNVNISKGSQPGQVAVEFVAEGGHRQDFDIAIPKGVYHSRQGWSGGVKTTTAFGLNQVGAGVISDGDASVERFSGLQTRYERTALGTSRVRLGVDFDSYHNQWNSSTVAAAQNSHFAPDLFRSRQHVSPAVTVVLAEPLTLTAGVSFDVLEPQLATGLLLIPAANTTLQWHQKLASAGQVVDAAYTLRAAGGDRTYTRQAFTAGYSAKVGNNAVAVSFLAGRISGDAPLYDRFVLGNGSTLRGYNKYDLDPLGGARVMHGSVDYSYRLLQVFYDSGAIWDPHTTAEARQSAGIGFGRAGKDGFMIAAAFPLRSGHIDPMFILGFNF